MPDSFRDALFIHGAGGGGWEWAIWARVFAAAGFVVAAPDLRPSAAGIETTRLDDYLAQVRNAIAAMPRPRVLIGASLGGLLVASNHDLADALVLVNPLPPAPWHLHLPTHLAYSTVVPWRREASLAGTRRAMPDADDAACLFAFRHWRDESGAAMNAARDGVAVNAPGVPTLVLASERDEDVPIAVSAGLAEQWRADLIRLPGASHVGPLLGRNAGWVAAQAVAWLNGLRQPG